jgi:hypothetical protein
MLDKIFKNINDFFVKFFDALLFREKPILNNDVESCCILLNDDTNTFSE